MFDLLAAVRRKQQAQSPPPAETAETAETAQPRGLDLAENLRKTADFSPGDIFPATIRKNPQTPKTGKPASTLGFGSFSAYPQNPQPPDALLLDSGSVLPPLTQAEHQSITEWLDTMGETSEAIRREFLQAAERDPRVRRDLLEWARDPPRYFSA
ncbi:hypothetical protein Q4485_09680 [Granulosicoccaceae sp. 1_MG-2023]|nr:hypothetical protein [Granulosicoccaceae sp. 1_MG-2023]